VREGEVLAVARLSRKHLLNEAEFAVLISDEYQGRGLGTELVKRLLEVARAEKMDRVTAEILQENTQMQRVCRMLGFKLAYRPDEGTIFAEFPLAELPL
jgi:acetyltransferase